MKLIRQVNRKTDTATYYKYLVILPSRIVDRMGWGTSTMLDYELLANGVILSEVRR